MSSRIIIKQTIQKMGDILIDAFTGKKHFDVIQSDYQSLRRRLIAYKPFIGNVPDFLMNAPDLYSLWHQTITSDLADYESRRIFVRENFTEYYKSQMNQFKENSFEEEIFNRDMSLEDELGSGGFGVVYKVHHIVLDEYRAVKKLDPLFADANGELKALRRFAREIKILNGLDNKYIVKVYDAGIADNCPFYVMEYIDGVNLQEVINTHGLLTLKEATTMMLQILDAISHAHEKDIIHRDIKSTNILWNGEQCIVLDFGASQWITERLSTRITSSAIGTQGYIAPELYDNPQLKEKSIDCYSLGILFHVLLTGKLPTPGNTEYYLNEQEINDEIINFIVKSISNENIRFQNATTMLHELQQINI